MTIFQKIVKYFAIVLAFSIIIGMVAGAIKGLSTISKISDFTTSDGKVEKVEQDSGVKKLRIKLFRTSLVIVEGEAFNAETDNEDVTVKERFGTLIVEENSKSIIDSMEKTKLVLTVPNDFVFDEIKITTGAGKFDAQILNAKKIDLNFGAGAVGIDKIIAASRTEITGGAGMIEIRDGKTNNLSFDMGIGKLHYRAEITGESEIDCGVGDIDMVLLGGEENYTLDLDKGLGIATIKGVTVNNETEHGNGINEVDINGGVGDIKVEFE